MKILHVHMYDQLSGAQKVSLDEFSESYRTKDNMNYHLVTNGSLKISGSNSFSRVSADFDVKTFRISSLNNSVTAVFKIWLFFRLYDIIIRNNIDIVHSHSTVPGLICKILSLFLRKKVFFVHTIHGTAWHKNRLVRKAIDYYEILTSIGLKAIICMRSSDYRLLHYFYKGRVHFLYNSAFLLPPVKTSAQDSILWIGRYEKQKNPLFAVDIAIEMSKHCEVGKTTFFGDGSLKQHMIKKARIKPGRIEINSWTSNINTQFIKARYLLVTSLYEGMPLTILEAMSHGLCVISVNYPGIHDLLDDERGIIISASTPKEFSYQFIEAIKTRDIDMIRNNAYNFAKTNFSHAQRYERIKQIYSEISLF